MLDYFLTLIICFLGLFIGAVLALMAKEELKAGKKYFVLMQQILIMLIVFFVLFGFDVNIYVCALISFAALAVYYFLYSRIKTQSIYILLTLAFFTSYLSEYFTIIASLIFIFGLPAGSMFAENSLKKGKSVMFERLFLNYCWFMVIALLPPFFIYF